MRTRPILAAALLAATAGCFPAITHGPQIEQGFIIGVTGEAVSGPTHVEGDEGGIHLRDPAVGPFLGYGWAPARPTDVGFYLGATVPLLFPLAQVDAFVQLPPSVTGKLAAGVGAVASVETFDLYGMIGAPINPSTRWYVGGGYGARLSSDTPTGAWIGSAGIEKASGHLRAQFFVQGATGQTRTQCSYLATGTSTCGGGDHATAVAAGISLGRHSRSAR